MDRRHGVGLAVGGTDGDLASVHEALRRSPYPAVREVRATARDGAVVLSGSVRSFYHFQMAQEAVKASHDHLQVLNEVKVLGYGQREAA